MRAPKHTAVISAVAVAIVLFSSAAFAFSVRIGSFHITIGSHGHRHHHDHHLVAPSRPAAPDHAAAARDMASPLFYPQFALPDLLANVFSSSSAWPFDNQSIVGAAFTRQEPLSAQVCEPQSNLADKFLAPLDAALALTDAQAQSLDKVGDALDAAQNVLAKSCPDAVPSAPIARLQLMDSQIGQLAAALDGIRPALQNFQHALTDEQLARFAVMIAAPNANNGATQSGDAAPSCGGDPSSTTDRAVSLMDQAVQPAAAQRDAVNAFKEALGKAAADLQADCSAPIPPTGLGRLGMIATRLDTTRRAVRSIEAALTRFRATARHREFCSALKAGPAG
jgi:LTXXQ motif family protein